MKKMLVIILQLLVLIGNTNTLHDFLGLNKPFFNPSSGAVLETQEGGIAYLPCEVYNLNNLSVSWVRGHDSHILTVDRETFISDKRFVSMHRKEKMSDTITLSIYEIAMKDQGKYECQVSSQPKISKIVKLVVKKPEVKILGDPDIHVKEGSEVRLKCVITNTVGDVPFVTWLFNDKVCKIIKKKFKGEASSKSISLSLVYTPTHHITATTT